MSDLPSLAHLQAETLDTSEDAWSEYRGIIEHGIGSAPRHSQKRIGPSEVGNPCDRCLIHRLAGTPRLGVGAAWLPFIGTAVHEQLEGFFAQANAALPAVRYLIETTVSVGDVGGQDITGHADLFDLALGDVTDWKIVGKTTLDKARRHGPSAAYRTQGHLYGRGFARRGLAVRNVRIAFLPRNALSLGHALMWEEPYDEQVALAGLARADQFANWIAALGAEAVLAGAPEHTGTEHSCKEYPDSQALEAQASKQLSGLLTPQTPDANSAGSNAA